MKYTLIALFAALLAVSALGAQELDSYTMQFNSMKTVQEQLGLVQSAKEDLSADEAAGFYAMALGTLLNQYRNVTSVNEKKAADDMAKILCGELGQAEYADAAPDFWRTVGAFTDPLVKAEALRALGKVQAETYLPQVVQLLLDINNAPSQDRLIQEQIAYGAIESLESYKDSSGYLPVFLAATGWYSDRVTDRAKKALPNIMDNPLQPLVSVIKSSSYSYYVKLTALQTLETSEIASNQKAEGAVAALADAWRSSTSDTRQRSTLASARKLALSMIRRYGTDDANVYQYLERCYKEGIDAEEQIAAVAALSALASDDSARLLSAFLADMTERLKSGALTREDERMVRVIIPALGATGKSSARAALRSVQVNDWTGAVQRLAQDALKKIQ